MYVLQLQVLSFPCRHIFHLDSEVKVLTTMFAENGMEVYETIGLKLTKVHPIHSRNIEVSHVDEAVNVLQVRVVLDERRATPSH